MLVLRHLPPNIHMPSDHRFPTPAEAIHEKLLHIQLHYHRQSFHHKITAMIIMLNGMIIWLAHHKALMISVDDMVFFPIYDEM